MGGSLAAFPITAVKQGVAGRSLAADFKLLTCFWGGGGHVFLAEMIAISIKSALIL